MHKQSKTKSLQKRHLAHFVLPNYIREGQCMYPGTATGELCLRCQASDGASLLVVVGVPACAHHPFLGAGTLSALNL